MAERRQKNTPLDADGKQRQYRLRKVGTLNEYQNYYRSVDVFGANGQRIYEPHGQRPTFNKRGKVHTTVAEAQDALADYALRRLRYPHDKADFPDLEIVVSVVVFETVADDKTPSTAAIQRLDKFSKIVGKESSKGGKKRDGDYSSEFAFARKLTFSNEPFRYILVTQGEIDRNVLKATAAKARIGVVGRMAPNTICCFAVNTDTDLTFARMALNENLTTIWDFQKSKLIYGQPVSKY